MGDSVVYEPRGSMFARRLSGFRQLLIFEPGVLAPIAPLSVARFLDPLDHEDLFKKLARVFPKERIAHRGGSAGAALFSGGRAPAVGVELLREDPELLFFPCAQLKDWALYCQAPRGQRPEWVIDRPAGEWWEAAFEAPKKPPRAVDADLRVYRAELRGPIDEADRFVRFIADLG